MPHFVKQIPNTSVSYSQLLAEFICVLTVKLDKLEAKIQEDEMKVDVFSCSVFDDNQALVKEFETVSRVNSIQLFRVLELVIKLACISPSHLANICIAKFNINETLSMHLSNENGDILSKLNCIELLYDLVRTTHGYEFLAKSNHLNHLLLCLVDPDKNPFADFLQPALIKLFSVIVKEMPHEAKSKYPAYFEFLFQVIRSEDLTGHMTTLNLVVETFYFLFESNLIKKFLKENYGEKLNSVLERLVWYFTHSINDKLKENVIKCLSEVIAVDSSLLKCYDKIDIKWNESAWNTDEWSELSRDFYTHLTKKHSHENLFNFFLMMAKKPFSELRLASQMYFNALAQTRWGIELLFTPNKYNSSENFLDGYLLSRAVEIEKQGLESKYELNKLLVANFKQNENLIHLIGDQYLAKLKQYVNQGPFYSGAESRVEFESI